LSTGTRTGFGADPGAWTPTFGSFARRGARLVVLRTAPVTMSPARAEAREGVE
jgi:hypothetical protein